MPDKYTIQLDELLDMVKNRDIEIARLKQRIAVLEQEANRPLVPVFDRLGKCIELKRPTPLSSSSVV